MELESVKPGQIQCTRFSPITFKDKEEDPSGGTPVLDGFEERYRTELLQARTPRGLFFAPVGALRAGFLGSVGEDFFAST